MVTLSNIKQYYPIMLPWQVMFPSGDVIYLPVAFAARSSVARDKDKRVADSFISVLSKCTVKLTKDRGKTRINL